MAGTQAWVRPIALEGNGGGGPGDGELYRRSDDGGQLRRAWRMQEGWKLNSVELRGERQNPGGEGGGHETSIWGSCAPGPASPFCRCRKSGHIDVTHKKSPQSRHQFNHLAKPGGEGQGVEAAFPQHCFLDHACVKCCEDKMLLSYTSAPKQARAGGHTD